MRQVPGGCSSVAVARDCGGGGECGCLGRIAFVWVEDVVRVVGLFSLALGTSLFASIPRVDNAAALR